MKRVSIMIGRHSLSTFLLIFIVTRVATGQVVADLSVHGNWLEDADIYGIGSSLHFVSESYAVELVPAATYYFSDTDSTDYWSTGIDIRLNIPVYAPIRPYVGAGGLLFRDNGNSRWVFNMAGGIHARILGDRIVPYVEAPYRPTSEVNTLRVQAGLRFILRER